MILFWSALLLSTGSAYGQETADTVADLRNATDILVVKEGNVTKVTANAAGYDGEIIPFEYEVDVMENDTVAEIEFDETWGLNLPYYSSNKNKRSNKIKRSVVGFEHLFWGWRFNYHDKDHVKNCFEVGIKQLIGVSWSKGRRNSSTFSIGLGFSFHRYLAQDGFAYEKTGDKITLSPVPAKTDVKTSRMDVWSLNIPILYKQGFAKHFNFSAGGIMNLNSYAKAMTEITDGKIKQKLKYKGLQQNLFTADLFVTLSYNEGIGIYFLWSPMNMFNKSYGPELKGWSIGIDLCSF